MYFIFTSLDLKNFKNYRIKKFKILLSKIFNRNETICIHLIFNTVKYII